jgi:hypothetical protein
MDCTALTVVEEPALPAELTAKPTSPRPARPRPRRRPTSPIFARGLNALPATAESLCAFLADQATLGNARAPWGAGWRPCGISIVRRAMRRRPGTRR